MARTGSGPGAKGEGYAAALRGTTVSMSRTVSQGAIVLGVSVVNWRDKVSNLGSHGFVLDAMGSHGFGGSGGGKAGDCCCC